MATKVFVKSSHQSTPISALVFFDCGSQTSFITNKFVKKLRPPKLDSGQLEVHTFNTRLPIRFHSSRYKVNFILNDETEETIILNSTDRIASQVTSISVDKKNSYDNINSAVTSCNEEPDILIGMAEFWRFFKSIENLENGLFIIHTTIGQLICGQDQENQLSGVPTATSSFSISSTNYYYELMPE